LSWIVAVAGNLEDALLLFEGNPGTVVGYFHPDNVTDLMRRYFYFSAGGRELHRIAKQVH
jgi:hypothetical protein